MSSCLHDVYKLKVNLMFSHIYVVLSWYYKDGGGKVAEKFSHGHFDVEKMGIRVQI